MSREERERTRQLALHSMHHLNLAALNAHAAFWSNPEATAMLWGNAMTHLGKALEAIYGSSAPPIPAPAPMPPPGESTIPVDTGVPI